MVSFRKVDILEKENERLKETVYALIKSINVKSEFEELKKVIDSYEGIVVSSIEVTMQGTMWLHVQENITEESCMDWYFSTTEEIKAFLYDLENK